MPFSIFLVFGRIYPLLIDFCVLEDLSFVNRLNPCVISSILCSMEPFYRLTVLYDVDQGIFPYVQVYAELIFFFFFFKTVIRDHYFSDCFNGIHLVEFT